MEKEVPTSMVDAVVRRRRELIGRISLCLMVCQIIIQAEQLAEVDDVLAEAFLSDQDPAPEDIVVTIAAGVHRCHASNLCVCVRVRV